MAQTNNRLQRLLAEEVWKQLGAGIEQETIDTYSLEKHRATGDTKFDLDPGTRPQKLMSNALRHWCIK